MKFLILLFVLSCSTIPHKPTANIDTSGADETIKSSGLSLVEKSVINSTIKNLKDTISSQGDYIAKLEKEIRDLRETTLDSKDSVASCSEDAGKWLGIRNAVIGVCVLVAGYFGFQIYKKTQLPIM